MTQPSRSLEQIAGDIFGVAAAEVVDEATPETLKQWNSLNHVHFVLALEEAYGVTLTAQEISSIRRIGDARRILRGRGISL